MKMQRNIRKLFRSKPVIEGAGVHLQRAFGFSMDVTVPAHSTYSHPTGKGHTVFAYVIEGNGRFCRESDPFSFEVGGASYFDIQRDTLLGNGTLGLFDDGDHVTVTAENKTVRFLLVSGKPLREQVAWHGPIV